MYMEQVKKILHNLCKKIWSIELKINSVKKQFCNVNNKINDEMQQQNENSAR